MEQRTVIDKGFVFYVYEDGSVEFLKRKNQNSGEFLYRTFGSKDGDGYMLIRRHKIVFKVHRLVALAFCPNPDNLQQVDHINRNRSDSRPCNLRWADHYTQQNNKTNIDGSIEKYGVRRKDDKKEYQKRYNKKYRQEHLLIDIVRPNGTNGHRLIKEEWLPILKPLSRKERYFKIIELKNKNNP